MNEEHVVELANKNFNWECSPIGGLWYSDKDALLAFANACCDYQREQDAKICDDKHYTWRFGDGDDAISGPKECAESIRANEEERRMR